MRLENRNLLWEIEDNKITYSGIPYTTGKLEQFDKVSIRGITCTKVYLDKKVMKYALKFKYKSYNHVDITIDTSKGYLLVTHIDFPRSPNG